MKKRELKHINGTTFELIIKDEENELTTIKRYEKKDLKNTYKILKLQLDQLAMQLKQLKSDNERINVVVDDKLKETLELILKAQEYDKKLKLIEQMNKVEEDIDLFKSQMKEISKEIPEVLRDKE